jgi:uncharacterized protein
MTKLTQAHGNWVSGERFWGREEDLELLTDRLGEGAHILLVAQRRMGKTSVMRELAQRLNDSYTCLFIDLEQATSPEEAIVELSMALRPHRNLWHKATAVFANVVGGVTERFEEIGLGDVKVKLRAGLNKGNWQEKGEAIFAVLASSDKPVIVFIDELPILVNRMLKDDQYNITPEGRREVDQFMSWLRKNSQLHASQIRLVLSGSIGLEPVLHQAGLSATVTNFQPYDLKPWDTRTAIGCLQALAHEYGVVFKDGAEAEMIRRLGYCIPHHVQGFFAHVHERCRRRGRMEFYTDEVNDVYEAEMLGVRGHAELAHYEERLRLVLGPDLFPLALEMLTETAFSGQLTPAALQALRERYTTGSFPIQAAQTEIMLVFEHDGYLKATPQGYVFQSPLLQDWWKRRHGLIYTPVLEREV